MGHSVKKKLHSKLLGLSCALMVSATGTSAMDRKAMNDEPSLPMGRESHDKFSLASGNLNAIEAFRIFYRENSDGTDTDKSLVEHQDIFVPFAQFLLETSNYSTRPKIEV
jgi:hypothetical protein